MAIGMKWWLELRRVYFWDIAFSDIATNPASLDNAGGHESADLGAGGVKLGSLPCEQSRSSHGHGVHLLPPTTVGGESFFSLLSSANKIQVARESGSFSREPTPGRGEGNLWTSEGTGGTAHLQCRF